MYITYYFNVLTFPNHLCTNHQHENLFYSTNPPKLIQERICRMYIPKNLLSLKPILPVYLPTHPPPTSQPFNNLALIDSACSTLHILQQKPHAKKKEEKRKQSERPGHEWPQSFIHRMLRSYPNCWVFYFRSYYPKSMGKPSIKVNRAVIAEQRIFKFRPEIRPALVLVSIDPAWIVE